MSISEPITLGFSAHVKLCYRIVDRADVYFALQLKTVYATEVLLALLGVAQLGICIWGAIICGVTGGFCSCTCPQSQPQPVMTVSC